MTKKTSSTEPAEHAFEVHGTVRDEYRQPLAKTTVKAYSKNLRGKHLLGEAITNASGQYTIGYTLKKAATAGVFVCIYENEKTVLKESEVHYKVPARLQIDIDLSGQPFTGASEYAQLIQTVTPFREDLALNEITETAEEKDISFIAQQTGAQQERIEILAMAARFQQYASIDMAIWYGILRQGVPYTQPGAVPLLTVPGDFEARLQTAFDALMHTPVARLMTCLQKAITGNIIDATVTKELPAIQEQLNTQQLAYAKKHPVTGDPSSLHRIGAIAGLKGKELDAFVETHNNHTDPDETIWQAAQKHTALAGNKHIEQVRTIFNLNRLVNNNLLLTEKLVTGNNITTDADIKKLAAYDHSNWESLLNEHKIELNGEATGRNKAEKIKNYASQLERSFTQAYPTASFTARLQKDTKNKWAHREKISDFLQKNEHFDLLNNHVETFLNENKETVTVTDKPVLADELRRVQRVFKLAPVYDTANVLLNDNIHSAHQIAKMGEDNFVNTYSDTLGNDEATRIFKQADAVHANAVALVGNLKSMTDTASIKAFSGLSQSLTTLTQVIPSLETLFGHADFCDCDECTSVYGAPAYLTDILHFLEQRLSTLDITSSKKPTVKELLLRRRPDIADIDLKCENANTEIPYIDIACELMEDFIAPPVITLPGSNFSLVAPGAINATLLNAIKAQFTATGQTSVSAALTTAAKVSASYTVKHLQTDNTYLTLTHWVIRDAQVILRVSGTSATDPVEFRLLHQTLLSAEANSASPEYINTKVYNNFLKTATSPFTLPFDLSETESELYLGKMGITKAGLIDVFARTGQPVTTVTAADTSMAYVSLGVNQAEQTLIFQADPTHQSLYWGSAAGGTSIPVNIFEKLSGLNYAQVVNLVNLQFINPAKDIVIEHDADPNGNIPFDTTKKRLLNLTGARLDAMHRFIRLWRKTSFTMDELDTIIMQLNGGLINPTLAYVLQQVLLLQQTLQLTPFQLLAFYGNLDITHDYPNCLYNQVFQNVAITNPVAPNLAISAIQAQTLALGDPDKRVIGAILQISLSDLNAILTQTGTAATVTFVTLSVIYRYAQLAHALGISVQELLNLKTLTGITPFTSPATTNRFIQKYRLLQSSGFTTSDLSYILRHQDINNTLLVPTPDQVTIALSQLQDELLAAQVATQPAKDINGSLLRKWLLDPVFKWDGSLLNKLLDILNTVVDEEYKQKIDNNLTFLLNTRLQYKAVAAATGLSALPLTGDPAVPVTIPAAIASQLIFDAANKQLRLTGYLPAADFNSLKALSTDAAWTAALDSLAGSLANVDNSTGNVFFAASSDITGNLKNIPFTSIADRFAIFINKLAPVYRKLKQQEILQKSISTWFNTDKKVAAALLLKVPAIYTDLTAENFVNKIPVTGNPAGPYPVQASRYQFVAKACFIAAKLQLREDAIDFLFTAGTQFGCLDVLNLPLTAVTGAGSTNALITFPGFEALINVVLFGQLYPAKQVNLSTPGNTASVTYSIFNILQHVAGATLATFKTDLGTQLAIITGWNTTDLTALITANFSAAAAMAAAPAILMRLHQCFRLLLQMGVPATTASGWCNAGLTFTDAANIKQALKAKYSGADWLPVTKPLQDKLREMKRDALIAYLLANPGTQSWNDENDLYSYFLLDVEMCSCQPTSRIVQATNSVQLFVQRCFLGLEESVIVNTKKDNNNSKKDAGWLQWDWMKNFRVWQANVKVFLYPENWIEPELLPDEIKSPFLKDLENDLLQNEVNALNAEDAFRRYLEQLSSVARLEIKGMWYDQGTKTLHVFGRTLGGDPKIYYHRKLINDLRWTPWVKVDADITGDHILPAMYNNRLYLFWGIFTEIADGTGATITVPRADENGVYKIPVAEPKKKWQIQLAFSEYRNGKWTPKVVSRNDATGQIVIAQKPTEAAFKGATLNKESFFFTALDIPNFDYSKIFVSNTDPKAGKLISQVDFNKNAANSVSVNGKLVISCYFYLFAQNNSYDNNLYVGSFQLDPVKGYPVQLSVKSQVLLNQAPHYPERSNRSSAMFNMLDAETFPTGLPPTNGIPGSGSSGILVGEQAGGPFSNLIPLQMDIGDRFAYMNSIYGLKDLSTFVLRSMLGTNLPYFYQDQRRTYYIVPENTDNGGVEFLYSYVLEGTMVLLEKGQEKYLEYINKMPTTVRYRYFNFFHPLVDYFIQQLFTGSIGGLLDRDTQLKGDFGYDPDNKFNFENYFQPVINGFSTIYSGGALPPVKRNGKEDKTPGYPKDNVDFNLQSGYGMYNWELFFHAPLMIAERLSQNQQFEDANRWYKYIFNPMDSSTYEAPAKYWNTQPFFLNVTDDYNKQRIENILTDINKGNIPTLLNNVADWRNNPFQPHFIAQSRTVAYQKAVVMKYVAHLIRHGDHLFTQQTMESVNEATQLYILAAEILGPKPELIPSPVTRGVDNYYQLEEKLDVLSDALVDVENLIPQQTIKGYTGITPGTGKPPLKTLYFSIPMNENMVGAAGYWDTVADRLFKIRHCLTIDGTFAPLSLFAPAIDPGMLVRATAAGLDIGSILNDVNAPLPLYRFMIMMQKASELCNDVKSLGASLLSALEKKDAESLSLLRSGHEIKLQNNVLLIKKKNIEESQTAIDNLLKQKELTTIRQKYYTGLIKNGLNSGEKQALSLNKTSLAIEAGIAVGYTLSGGLKLIPNFLLGVSGFGGTPHATAETGGKSFGDSAEDFVKTISSIAVAADKLASVISTQAGYTRRSDEWQFQLNLANKELEQLEKQLLGAQIRLNIANQDLANQQLQIDQSKQSDDFMRSKFTNEALFNWMITQVSNTYFKSYQLAYDIAKKAERCFRYELGLDDSAYINFGYWDSLKKGLLAGEQLGYDIKKMEMAYYEQNKRELELTKHISLSQIDPVALLQLKITGDCWINLPEELFDIDYPGHYMRRVKSVSITIPCITGPYTTVSCKLTMTRNSLRVSGVADSSYARKTVNDFPADDPRFRDSVGALDSIATSSAQNDSGLFELNFRDERYLPFEGAGVISLWHLQLPAAIHQFDYNTISDVIIHLKYTARDGGEVLKTNAANNLMTKINAMIDPKKGKGLMRIFSAKNDLSTEWYRFLHPAPGSDQVLTVNLDANRFPLFVQEKTIKIRSMELVVDTATKPVNNLHYSPAGSTEIISLTNTGAYGNWSNATIDYNSNKKDPGTWTITNPATNPRLTDSNPQGNDILVKNMAIIVYYEIS